MLTKRLVECSTTTSLPKKQRVAMKCHKKCKTFLTCWRLREEEEEKREKARREEVLRGEAKREFAKREAARRVGVRWGGTTSMKPSLERASERDLLERPPPYSEAVEATETRPQKRRSLFEKLKHMWD